MAIKRTVTVFNQNTQERTVLENVTAETFGELKTVLRNKGISLDGMDVREGISKVDLRADSALLPHDTPYKRKTTNDLMILLTKTNKKISSGIGRSEAVAYIKNNNLQTEVKEAYGKNWTNVSTEDLVNFVNGKMSKAPQDGAPAQEAVSEENAPAKAGKCDSSVKECLANLIGYLYDEDFIEEEKYDELNKILGGKAVKSAAKEPDKGFSQEEIHKVLNSMD